MLFLFVNTDTRDAVIVKASVQPPADLLADDSVLAFRIWGTSVTVDELVGHDFDAMCKGSNFGDVPRGQRGD